MSRLSDEHMAACHSDGSECPDGCDSQATPRQVGTVDMTPKWIDILGVARRLAGSGDGRCDAFWRELEKPCRIADAIREGCTVTVVRFMSTEFDTDEYVLLGRYEADKAISQAKKWMSDRMGHGWSEREAKKYPVITVQHHTLLSGEPK